MAQLVAKRVADLSSWVPLPDSVRFLQHAVVAKRLSDDYSRLVQDTSRIKPAYESRGVLARGGMGIVELAVREQGAFQRLYALKRLLPEYRQDERYRAMFLDEARVAGMIRHANVISVLDVGEDERGPFLVMDFIEGVSVGELIKWAQRSARTISVQLAARIIRQAAAGIEAAHQLNDENGRSLNLVHRDVSPQNIMIGFDGVVRVTDFGIAKSIGRVSQSTTNLLKGKAGYMAPEQLRFEDATQASDFFGLGVVFFELLAGRRLYAGHDSAAVARRILSEAPPDIFELREDVHPAICELLFGLLAKSKETRPASAGEVVERLDMVIDELSAEEGTERIDRFLAEHFADTIKERAALRQRATSESSDKWLPKEEELERDEPSPYTAATIVDSQPPEATSAPRLRQAQRVQKLLLGVVVALLAALVVIFFAWPNPAELVATPAEASATESHADAPPSSPAGTETNEEPAEANVGEDVLPEEPAAVVENMRRTRRTRGMTRRSMATMMATTAASRAVEAF